MKETMIEDAIIIADEMDNDVLENDVLENSLVGTTTRELSEEEKRELLIQAIKDSNGSKSVSKKHYGVAFKKERQRKNKQAKSSRKANRR